MIIYLKIEASDPDRPGVPVTIAEHSTTKELKVAIRKLQITGDFLLLFNGKTMEDNKTMKDYNIVPESAIHLLNRVHGGMQVFIKHMKGVSLALNVSEKTTVAELKQLYDSKTGVCAKEQRLLFGSTQLEDKYTLGHYNIISDSAIYVVFRLLGGNNFITQKLINMNNFETLSLGLNNQNCCAVKDSKIKMFCAHCTPEQR